MARNLVLSVGEGGVSFPEDVATVQQHLKALGVTPASDGAGLAPAIKEFQKKTMGMAKPTGRVDPDSATLYALTRAATKSAVEAFEGGLRWRIVQAAKSQTGKVSDRTPLNGLRLGHQNLQMYIDVAGRRKISWSDKTKRKYTDPAKNDHMITNLEGVQKVGMRIPQDGMGLGIQWCGIFATWAWITGGADAYWAFPGIAASGGAKVPLLSHTRCLAPGDVCILTGAMQHHVVVASVAADGKTFTTFEGNKDWQEVGPGSHGVAKVQAVYSLDLLYDPKLAY